MLLPFFTKILLKSFFLCDYTIFLTITHFLESNRLVRVLFSLIFFQSILKVNITFPSFFVFSSLWKLSSVINVLTTSVYLNPTFYFLFFLSMLEFINGSFITTLETAFSSMVEGKNEEMSTSELSGGARIHYIFQSIYVKSLEVCVLIFSGTYPVT